MSPATPFRPRAAHRQRASVATVARITRGLAVRILGGWLLAGAAGAALAAGAQTALPPEVLQSLARAGVPASAVSVLVAPLPETGAPAAPRLSWQADLPMNPASVMKLVTTYAGLDLLGPDFTWTNRIYVDGPVVNGVLNGNLIIRGSGDPKLVLERLQALIRQIMAAGVREVRGDILLDRSIFDVPERNPADFDDEPLRPYNASPDGLLVNFKSLIFTFTPDTGAARAQVKSEPPIAGVDIPAALPLSGGACADWRSALRADFADPKQVRFSGRYAAACGERQWPVAYVDPRSFATRVVQAMWLAEGGQLGGRVREAATPPGARLWVSAESLPLADIIADINKFSNNVMAQQLFLTLSSQNQGTGSFEASRQRLARWWRARFANQAEPLIENGSGLSRQERTSAAALTALLQKAASGPAAATFQQSLGLAGVDGTVQRMRDRNGNAEALGRAWLKTGSLRDVASVAGYVTGRSGGRYSLVVIVNHENASAVRATLDQLVEWTARLP